MTGAPYTAIDMLRAWDLARNPFTVQDRDRAGNFVTEQGMALFEAYKAIGGTLAERRRWRKRDQTYARFLLLVERDLDFLAGLDTLRRTAGSTDVSVGRMCRVLVEQFELFEKKLAEAKVMRAILHRQNIRARRLDGREGITGEPIKRPTDQEFLEEAAPPRVRRPHGS